MVHILLNYDLLEAFIYYTQHISFTGFNEFHFPSNFRPTHCFFWIWKIVFSLVINPAVCMNAMESCQNTVRFRVVLLQLKWTHVERLELRTVWQHAFSFLLRTVDVTGRHGYMALELCRCFCQHRPSQTRALGLCLLPRGRQPGVCFNLCSPICCVHRSADTSARSFRLQMLSISLSENILS